MDVLTNRLVLDIIKKDTVDAACKHLFKAEHVNASYKTLHKDLTRLYGKYQHLNKSKTRVKGKQNLDKFLCSKYAFPEDNLKEPSGSKVQHESPFSPTDDPYLKANTYKSVCDKLAGELIVLKKKNIEINDELEVVVEEKDELNESLECTDKTLINSKKALKRTANRETYWREKCLKIENERDDGNEMEVLRHELDYMTITLKEKDRAIHDLKSQIDEITVENEQLKHIEDAEFYNADSKVYSTALHECVYSLLDQQVSCENVPNVINSVCNLLGKRPNKLPTVRTINNWSIERSVISRRQIATMSSKENTTLHTDEASKYGQKWGAFASRDADGEYVVLGLRDMATKSSHDTLDTFKEILNDIDLVSQTEQSSANEILVNIKNTMSDRAATETKFNKLLQEYRDELLPAVYKNYDAMNLESQQAVSRMNNFFCGLHTLVHMADVSQKSIYDIEKTHFDDVPIHNPAFNKAGQSGTVRTVFTACKAFARRGDQKNGCHQAFRTFVDDFLKDNKLLSLPLEPLRGNRFNILFSNAGHVYFLKDKMVEYLQKSDNSNGLLLSVLHDLSTPFFISGCKALGLISKYITTPLWRIIENKEITISTMNQKYEQLLNYLNTVVDNLEEFIIGRQKVYPEVEIKHDKVLEKLLQPSENDHEVILILSVVLPALAMLIQRQYGDHLPGGIHEHVNVDETKSVDKHNKFPERVFSLVDHILAAKPNISTLALEAQIMFSLNKTSAWLKQQENASEIIEQSRKEASKERQRFKQRATVILAKRIEKQEEDFRRKAIRERNRVEKLEKETNDMLFYGLWQSESQLEEKLGEINSQTEKENALKVQLRFRKNVFKQISDKKNVYAFSQVVDGKRKPSSVHELKDNVKYLIGQTFNTPPEQSPHILVGKQVEHKWIESDQPKWYTGKVISQVPGFPAWFNLVYEDDPAVYTAKLGEDYSQGDVVIKA